MDKLEKTMSKGFVILNSKLEILSDYYVKRDEMERIKKGIIEWTEEKINDVTKTANLNQKIK